MHDKRINYGLEGFGIGSTRVGRTREYLNHCAKRVVLKHVATAMAVSMSGSRTCAIVVKMRATFPKSCRPRVMGASSPVLLLRRLSKICGTRARLRMGMEQTCSTVIMRMGTKDEYKQSKQRT